VRVRGIGRAAAIGLAPVIVPRVVAIVQRLRTAPAAAEIVPPMPTVAVAIAAVR
jgi:hypothetical protein